MTYVMVLNDGETFTALAGCSIQSIPDHVYDDDIDAAIKEGVCEIVTTFEEGA